MLKYVPYTILNLAAVEIIAPYGWQQSQAIRARFVHVPPSSLQMTKLIQVVIPLRYAGFQRNVLEVCD